VGTKRHGPEEFWGRAMVFVGGAKKKKSEVGRPDRDGVCQRPLWWAKGGVGKSRRSISDPGKLSTESERSRFVQGRAKGEGRRRREKKKIAGGIRGKCLGQAV